MIRLTDRATGNVLGDVSLADFQLMRSVLTQEDATDADYYLTADTLDLLAERGLGDSTLSLLRGTLADWESLDLGWELPYAGTSHAVSGRVLSAGDAEPLPGLKVEAYDGGRLVGWSFTRADGTFEVELGGPGAPGVWEAQPVEGQPDVGLEILALDGTVLLSMPSERMGSPRRSYADLVVEEPLPLYEEDEELPTEEEGAPPDPAMLDQMMTLDRPLEHPLGETGASDPHPMEDVEDASRSPQIP